ncbi:hypothetical protein F4814DRAFT_219162 [Daldinia grandis]|nr:hypothetical protein F4814DRAFT_219162 [Daldinia grandis]
MYVGTRSPLYTRLGAVMSLEMRSLVGFSVPQSSSFLCSSRLGSGFYRFSKPTCTYTTVIFDRPIGWTKLCRFLYSCFLLVIVPEGCKRKPNRRFGRRLKLSNPIRSRDFHRAVRKSKQCYPPPTPTTPPPPPLPLRCSLHTKAYPHTRCTLSTLYIRLFRALESPSPSKFLIKCNGPARCGRAGPSIKYAVYPSGHRKSVQFVRTPVAYVCTYRHILAPREREGGTWLRIWLGSSAVCCPSILEVWYGRE